MEYESRVYFKDVDGIHETGWLPVTPSTVANALRRHPNPGSSAAELRRGLVLTISRRQYRRVEDKPWIPLSELPAGRVFETKLGSRHLKTDETAAVSIAFGVTETCIVCYSVEKGVRNSFPPSKEVREVPVPATSNP